MEVLDKCWRHLRSYTKPPRRCRWIVILRWTHKYLLVQMNVPGGILRKGCYTDTQPNFHRKATLGGYSWSVYLHSYR